MLEIKGHLTRQAEDGYRLKVLEWLTAEDGSKHHADAIKQREEGTGQWLLESEQYQDWVQTHNKTMFCHGIPGAGKTICSAIVIEDLASRCERQANCTLAYLYCKFQHQQEQSIDNLLLCMLRQLSDRHHSLPVPVQELFQQHQERKTRPSTDWIVRTLKLVVAMYTKVYLVVDALDECKSSCCKNLIDQVFAIQAASGANFFATSRPLDIVERFQRSISIEIRATEGDVRKYLDKRMTQFRPSIRNKPDFQEEIKVGIVNLVEGMLVLPLPSVAISPPIQPTGSSSHNFIFNL